MKPPVSLCPHSVPKTTSSRGVRPVVLHSLYGVALGAAFLIIAVLFDAGARGMAFDADGIIETIATQPLLWLIATVPLVLGLFPWLIGPRPEASQQDHAANEGTVGGEIDRLFDVPGDLLALVGFDGHFKRINPAWQETLGHSMPVVLKTPLIDLVHPEDRNATIEQLSRLAEGQAFAHFENRYLTGAGDWRRLSWTAAPLGDRDVVFCAAKDVTTRFEAEEALRAEAEGARSASRSKMEFVAKMSYELRRARACRSLSEGSRSHL